MRDSGAAAIALHCAPDYQEAAISGEIFEGIKQWEYEREGTKFLLPGFYRDIDPYNVPTILAIWLLMMGVISLYRLDRTAHEKNLRELAARRSAG